MNHISTPETDARFRKESHSFLETLSEMQDLEQRLTIARKALESIANDPLSQASIEKLAEETLKLTKPKL